MRGRASHAAAATSEAWPPPRERTDGRIDAMPRRKLSAIEQAAKALAKLSDLEWLQVKCDEDRRRAEQRNIRSLSKRYRELRKPRPGAGARQRNEMRPRGKP